jgi:hypothetical protein
MMQKTTLPLGKINLASEITGYDFTKSKAQSNSIDIVLYGKTDRALCELTLNYNDAENFVNSLHLFIQTAKYAGIEPTSDKI